jgi:hypothetical protein
MCRGDSTVSSFVWDWLAQLLQEPERKPGVALLIRGAKGTGKTTFSDVAARLVGERYSPVVDSVEGFVGRFSGHLEQALLIRVEEAYHAQNPSHESRLKTLITASRLPVERKGFDAFMADNYARVIATSNAAHLVPAGGEGGERRFCVLDILPTRQQDGAFFAALWKQMEGGGYAELFRDLMARDISKRDWSKPPLTDGLADQIRLSLKSNEGWWADLLTSGTVAFTRTPELLQDEALEWPWDAPWTVERTALYASFSQFAPGFRSPPSPALLGRFLQEACPGIGERRVGPQGSRTRCYILPPRRDALRAFEAARPGLSLMAEVTRALPDETARADQPREAAGVVAFSALATHARLAA